MVALLAVACGNPVGQQKSDKQHANRPLVAYQPSDPPSTPQRAASRSNQPRVIPKVYEIRTNARAVAITFDDGPNPTYTPQILNLLAKHDAHATCFVVGNIATHYSALVRRTARSGNEVANHGWSHARMTDLSGEKLHSDIEHGAIAISQITGQKPTSFRPPYGCFNETVVEIANSLGETVVLWTYSTSDWMIPQPRVILRRVLRHLRPGAIILLHDGGGPRRNTVRALAMILLELHQQGYRAVTVRDLMHLGSVVSVDQDA